MLLSEYVVEYANINNETPVTMIADKQRVTQKDTQMEKRIFIKLFSFFGKLKYRVLEVSSVCKLDSTTEIHTFFFFTKIYSLPSKTNIKCVELTLFIFSSDFWTMQSPLVRFSIKFKVLTFRT